MYPMNLCEIMRDLVMPRCCFGYVSFEPPRDYAGFGYVSFVFVVSVMFRLSLLFRLCSYSWLCIVYYINDTILYKGCYL